MADADSAIVNIYWTDRLGHTGSAEWPPSTAGRSASVAFSASVPVHTGPNRITVIAVDSRNQSGSAQLSVYSEAPRGPTVSEVQSGWWHGRPVTYAVINGQAVVEGDMTLGPAAQVAASAPPGSPSGSGPKPHGFTIGYVSQLWPASTESIRSPTPSRPAHPSWIPSSLTSTAL